MWKLLVHKNLIRVILSLKFSLQLKSLNSVSSKRQWVVLRKQHRGNPASLELYKNEDQTVAPIRTIPLDRRVRRALIRASRFLLINEIHVEELVLIVWTTY